MEKLLTVAVPSYNAEWCLNKCLSSFIAEQAVPDRLEVIVINDGSTDDTERFIRDFLNESRIRYIKNEENKGLGYAINHGLEESKNDYIAYLPSDDYYFENHLELISEEFKRADDVVLVFTSAKSEIKDSLTNDIKTTTNGLFNNYSLQFVQTSHRKTQDIWITRKEWVSENLYDLFWKKLVDKGKFVFVNKKTCFWTDHPHQHHKLVGENYNGGLNIYRQFYQIKEPIKIKVSESKFIDEEALYKDFQTSKIVSAEKYPLKILIVGELAYNAERVFTFEKLGHKLYGLWIERPTFSFSTVGPLPFGNITDIPYDNWEEKVKEIQPDIIYATLNFGAVDLAYEVLKKNTGVPFVWHFKEGPFVCMKKGIWRKLIELYDKADGKIYINPEIQKWYEQYLPDKGLTFILDGDLPKNKYFSDDFSARLSEQDGEVHTVIPGRAVGIELQSIMLLAQNGIHIHAYVENYHSSRDFFNKEAQKSASKFFHLHPHCSADSWVKEFSKYDAGWLHCFDSSNGGKLEYAGWNDLNIPARMNTLAAAGLPMIQKRNADHIVAMKSRVEKDDMGIFFDTFEELAALLKDKTHMQQVRDNVIKNRHSFSFDYHVDSLIDFFREVIKAKKNG